MKYDASIESLIHPETLAPLPPSPALPWNTAALCAELSRLAYFKDRDEVKAACEAHKLGDPCFFDDDDVTGTQAFAVCGKGEQAGFIAFRGTQPKSLKDILADTRFKLDAWRGGGRVHTGFAWAYDGRKTAGVSSQIRAWLQEMRAQGWSGKLYVTGHSLGAALATLAAQADFPDASLIIFGSPRVGDALFAARLKQRNVQRYVNCCDLVTNLVIQDLIGYQNIAGERYIDRNGQQSSSTSPITIAADRLRAAALYPLHSLRPWNVPSRDLADHAMINYISALLGMRE